jgi:uncharacterized protein YkwD
MTVVAGAAVGVAMVLVGACATADTTRLMSLINADRASHGIAQLEGNWPLVNKAASQAQAMSAAGYIFHSNLAAGNPYAWRALGENVTVVSAAQGVDQANAQFLASPDHRANMENRAYNYVGAASYQDSHGTLWVVEEFMQL